MNISPKTRTVTDIIIELSEDEAREATHSPDKLQTAIRQAFAAQRKGIIAKSAAPKFKERKQIERVPCQSCGVMIAQYKQGRHKCKSALAAK